MVCVIGEIRVACRGEVTECWCPRVEFLLKSSGDHLYEIIFKEEWHKRIHVHIF